jgi:hypothetical protein
MVKLYLLAKPLIFYLKIIYFWIILKIIFSTKSFNKSFWLPYWLSYLIDLFFNYLCTYLHTYILIYLPTHLPFTHLPTYHLQNVMSTTIWYTKYDGIALNELTTILIVFDPLMSINCNLTMGIIYSIYFCDSHIDIAYFGSHC